MMALNVDFAKLITPVNIKTAAGVGIFSYSQVRFFTVLENIGMHLYA